MITTINDIFDDFADEIESFKETESLSIDLYNALYQIWVNEMPYGIAKGRIGDPYSWVADHLQQAIDEREGES